MDRTERGVTVREARPEDVPAMMELARWSETASHWGEEVYARMIEGGDSSRVTLCVEDDGEFAGFVVAGHVGPEWEIENVVVAQQKMRRGIGGRLVEALLERAKREGGESVFLEVRESNEAARALYRKWGFEEVGRRRGYYSGPAEDGVVYRKRL